METHVLPFTVNRIAEIISNLLLGVEEETNQIITCCGHEIKFLDLEGPCLF